jgi:hypothetical protein
MGKKNLYNILPVNPYLHILRVASSVIALFVIVCVGADFAIGFHAVVSDP